MRVSRAWLSAAAVSASWLLVVGASLTGSSHRQSDSKAIVDDYRRLIDLYAKGDADSAVAAVRTWQVNTIRALQTAQTWDRTVMRAAAMLETDAALVSAREAADEFPPYAVPTLAQQPIALRIGLAEGWLAASDRVKPPDKSPFRARWYAAVGRWLLRETYLALAESLLADGCRLFPRDPDLLLTCGLAREARALDFSVNPALALTLSESPAYTRNERSTLVDAARWLLQRAVDGRPESVEARLRLAHVHVLRRDDRGAAPRLGELRQPVSSSPAACVAALLLGDLLMRRGDVQTAVEIFVQARRLVPGAQSADLAHASALQSAGDRDAAAIVMRDMLARDPAVADPWTDYPVGLSNPELDLESLRSEVRQQPRAAPVPPHPAAPVPEITSIAPAASRKPSSGAGEPVVVDVLVTTDHAPAAGLAAADFELRDNGVLQRIELVDPGSIRIDLRLAIDLSRANLSPEGVDHLRDAAGALTSALGADDRAQVLTFAGHIRSGDSWAKTRTALEAGSDRVAPAERRPRLVDATFAALTLPGATGARMLVLLFSDGQDTSSWLTPAAVVRTARESPATVYSVTIPRLTDPSRPTRLNLGRLHRWLMEDPRAFREAFLPVLVNETGGELLNAVGSADLRPTFLDVLSRFRQRYVLKYVPERVAPTGWHQLGVRVRDKRMQVVARTGYQR